MEQGLEEGMHRMLKRPGIEVEYIDESIVEQLRANIQSDLTFFGGHPKSLEKQEADMIFRIEEGKDERGQRTLLPCKYNVCEKTDGCRYILIVAETGECYFVSRNTRGQRMPVFFKVNIAIAPNFSELSPEQHGQKPRRVFGRIVEILDGELVVDVTPSPKSAVKEERLRYLIFDTLVHLRRDVRDLNFVERLRCAELFLQNNEFSLKWKGNTVRLEGEPPIEMFVKDFFDLDGKKERQLEFVFKTYIKSMNHKNDGVIFNRKENAVYKLGKNEGYLKWKPPELNTVDFLLVPNENWDTTQTPNLKVVDLYLQWNDPDTGTYRPIFYEFMVVETAEYEQIHRTWERLMEERSDTVNGVIAECNFVKTPADRKPVYRRLYDVKHSLQDIQSITMKASDSDEQNRLLKRLQNLTYESNWSIVKFREDKNTANAISTAENVVRTINENLSEDRLIEKANIYFRERTERENEIRRNLAR